MFWKTACKCQKWYLYHSDIHSVSHLYGIFSHVIVVNFHQWILVLFSRDILTWISILNFDTILLLQSFYFCLIFWNWNIKVGVGFSPEMSSQMYYFTSISTPLISFLNCWIWWHFLINSLHVWINYKTQ